MLEHIEFARDDEENGRVCMELVKKTPYHRDHKETRPGCYRVDPIVATRLVCRWIRYTPDRANVTIPTVSFAFALYAYIPLYLRYPSNQ